MPQPRLGGSFFQCCQIALWLRSRHLHQPIFLSAKDWWPVASHEENVKAFIYTIWPPVGSYFSKIPTYNSHWISHLDMEVLFEKWEFFKKEFPLLLDRTWELKYLVILSGNFWWIQPCTVICLCLSVTEVIHRTYTFLKSYFFNN